MTWLYNGTPLTSPPENSYGFVYTITNTVNGKQYIGKKFFWHKKTKIVKGKKKRYIAESDWATYYGSSPSLTSDVKQFGADQFHRTILHICNSKGDCAYWEAKEQIQRDVLFHPETYYNDWIICRVHRKHVNRST